MIGEVDINNVNLLPYYCHCVYILLDENRKPLYVGKAINPKARVSQHLRGTSNKKAIHSLIKSSIVISHYNYTGLEKFIIRKLKPPYNLHTNKKYSCVDNEKSYIETFKELQKYNLQVNRSD